LEPYNFTLYARSSHSSSRPSIHVRKCRQKPKKSILAPWRIGRVPRPLRSLQRAGVLTCLPILDFPFSPKGSRRRSVGPCPSQKPCFSIDMSLPLRYYYNPVSVMASSKAARSHTPSFFRTSSTLTILSRCHFCSGTGKSTPTIQRTSLLPVRNAVAAPATPARPLTPAISTSSHLAIRSCHQTAGSLNVTPNPFVGTSYENRGEGVSPRPPRALETPTCFRFSTPVSLL